eukprot:364481-Chlamydomonas_euryale.AAC.20
MSMVPSVGTLAFDFVSAAVPPADAVPISDDQLMEFLANSVGVGVDPSTGVLVPEHDDEKADLMVRVEVCGFGNGLWPWMRPWACWSRSM